MRKYRYNSINIATKRYTLTTTLEYRPTPQPHEALEFSNWHERCVEHLLHKSGLEVQREPLICGKTPDLLVTPPQGNPFIVECIARLQDPSHAIELTEHGWHYCGGNIRDLHQNIYSRLDHKATKYRDIAEQMPYIISLYDASCMNGINTAIDLVLSPYAPVVTRSADGRIIGKNYHTLWSTPSIPAALFELYPHLSGFIYSRWPREHYYLPNPYATTPIPSDLFSFAQVPELPAHYVQADWRPRRATVVDDYESPPEVWRPQMERLSQALMLEPSMAI